MREGDKVVITAKSHPHYGKAGEIEAPATGHLASMFDWTVKLNGAYEPSCYVSSSEIRPI